MVNAGLTPQEALFAATIGGARFLQRDSEIGSIAVGYRADMLLLRGNPLQNILATRLITAVIGDRKLIEDVVTSDD